MRTLKLEEIAPYYPYGLKAIDYDNNACNIIALYDDIVMVRYDLNVGDYELGFDEFKPILRPLSDFYHSEADNEIGKTRTGYIEVSKEGFHADDLLLYDHFKILVKHHFDVFGLIDAGLGIDINSLKS